MECPACRSTDLQSLSLVYNSGLFDLKGHFAGAFAGGLYSQTGVRQSRLSQMAAPPKKRSYLFAILLWFLASALVAVVMAQMLPGNYSEVQRGDARAQAPRQVGVNRQSHLRSAADPVLNNIFGFGCLGLLLILLLRVYRYNHYVFPPALQKWNSSFMCRRCGAFFETRYEKQTAAG